MNNRTKNILAQMSLNEKVDLMSGNFNWLKMIWHMLPDMHYNKIPYPAGGNKRLGVPEVKFCDGPRGLVSGNATCFPVAMGRGASFDIDLEEKIGQAIGKEIRAIGGNYFGGVCINLLRHPAGGRAQETFGEDPFHVGQMGMALMRGVQSQNVMACIKHFALNNQENARFKVNVECDERVLREVYLPHFEDCVKGGAASVMGAYNLFRGEHCCHNSYLLRTILKGEWGFEGFVISDFIWGVKDTVAAANAGLDIEMPLTRFYGKKLVKAVENGDVQGAVIDEAAERIICTILQYAEAPDPQPDYPKSLIVSADHVALALQAAEKSMVLLKNEQQTLPLQKDRINKIALLGELAAKANIGDHGSSRVYPPYVVTPKEGLQSVLGREKVLFNDGQDVEEAKRLAAEADAVVIVVGYDHDDEGEFLTERFIQGGGDRDSLRLNAQHEALIQAVAPLNERTIVVLIGGSAILMEAWKAAVPAIIHAFYPGMEGGTAMAKILFGKANPGGKLPFTIPSDAAHLPDFDKDAEQVRYTMFHGYTKLEMEGHEAAFPFGFGLSYTSFEQSNPVFEVQEQALVAAVDVSNTGEREGDQVIQLYVGFENSKVDRPKKLLKGFKRVSLYPGELKRVTITCPIEKLRWYNPQVKAWQLEAMDYQVYIGSSSHPRDLLAGSVFIS